MIYLTDYISEIRCPYCFSYVSILQKKESPLLIITCELCGKNEMSLNQYLSLINSNNIKSCNYCCKNHIRLRKQKYNGECNPIPFLKRGYGIHRCNIRRQFLFLNKDQQSPLQTIFHKWIQFPEVALSNGHWTFSHNTLLFIPQL